MTMSPAPHRHGMTLVELLVVVLILGLLAVTVLPNLTNSGENRRLREGVRAVSSFVANAQSRAIGQATGAGLWIDVLANQMGGSSIAIDLAAANVAQPYAGATTSSGITTLTASNLARSLSVTATFSETITLPPSGPYLLRFQGSRSWLDFALTTTSTTETSASGISGTIALRNSVGQTVANMAWPQVSSANPVGYEIVSPPTRNSVSSLTLGDRVAIDITNSTLGSNVLTGGVDYASIVVLFDPSGTPSQLVLLPRGGGSGARLPLQDPIFLLVASIESIQAGNSLTDPRSTWVAIDPRGGIPRVAEVNASGGTFAQKQSFIRAGLPQFGR